MPSVDDIAAEYVERTAALDPFYATYDGIAGHDHELPDLGADGFAQRAGLDRSTLAALDAASAITWALWVLTRCARRLPASKATPPLCRST